MHSVVKHRLLILVAGALLGLAIAFLLHLKIRDFLNVSLLVGAIALAFQSYLGSCIAGVTLWWEGDWGTGDTLLVNGAPLMSGRVVKRHLSRTILDQGNDRPFVARNSLLLNSFIAVTPSGSEPPS